LAKRSLRNLFGLLRLGQPRNIIDFGAAGDGLSEDGEALQRALDVGPGVVIVPEGTFSIGRTIRIGSGRHLKLEAGARLRLADGAARTPDDYLLTNADAENSDLTVEGGLWDGNNASNPRPKGLFDFGYTGAVFHFRGVTNLRLSDLQVQDAEAYFIRLTGTQSFHIEAIRFSSTRRRPNNDGVHIGGNCKNGFIRNIKGMNPGVTADDLIALNADDALDRTEVKGMTSGPICNISIERLEAESCHSFVRMLSVLSPIENINVRDARGTCEISAVNCDAARGAKVPLFDEKRPPFPDGVGMLRNVSIEDISVAKSVNSPIALLRLETRMENFRVKHFERKIDIDQARNTPSARIRHVKIDRMVIDNGQPTSAGVEQTCDISGAAIKELEINCSKPNER
jgi:hypothetical protein